MPAGAHLHWLNIGGMSTYFLMSERQDKNCLVSLHVNTGWAFFDFTCCLGGYKKSIQSYQFLFAITLTSQDHYKKGGKGNHSCQSNGPFKYTLHVLVPSWKPGVCIKVVDKHWKASDHKLFKKNSNLLERVIFWWQKPWLYLERNCLKKKTIYKQLGFIFKKNIYFQVKITLVLGLRYLWCW